MVHTFFITLDGVRRKDVLEGPDLELLKDHKIKTKYFQRFSKSVKNTLPFIHNTLISQGKLYDNLYIKNKYKISYPGYNDLITGISDPKINSNEYKPNPHKNYLEILIKKKNINPNKVLISTCWNKFSDIFNCPRNNLNIANWTPHNRKKKIWLKDTVTFPKYKFKDLPSGNKDTHHDLLVYSILKKNILKMEPEYVFLNLGLTDYYGHKNDYLEYWNHLVLADSALEDLINTTQKIEKYKDNSVYFITVDHGRGNKPESFAHHRTNILGSEESWLIVYGKNIKPEKITKKTPNTQIFEMLMKY